MLFYDPAERVVATLHPNHTYEKVVFDPWQQTTYDVNDTVRRRATRETGDPRTDPDIGGYVAAYFERPQPAPAGRPGTRSASAARWAPTSATPPSAPQPMPTRPTTAHFDALGRPFLTVARNRVVCAGHDLRRHRRRASPPASSWTSKATSAPCATPSQQAGDPLGRVVMRYAYDMLGNRIHQASMEAGARWMLNDVAGKPIRAWDSRGHNFTHGVRRAAPPGASRPCAARRPRPTPTRAR